MCDCEVPQFYQRERRTTRKPRVCTECRRPIASGEEYYRHSGKWDGDFRWWVNCPECEAAAGEYYDQTECCYPVGELAYEIMQIPEEDRTPVLTELVERYEKFNVRAA